MSLNKVMLIANLGQNPELRTTSSGQSVCSMRVATNESWTDAQGQKQERTEWHSIVVWGKTAENCNKYLVKGSKVYVEGRIQTREWEDKTGAKRYTTEIVADNVRFLSSKTGGPDEYRGGPLRAEVERIAGPLPDSRRGSYQPREASTNARNGPHGDWSREQTQAAVQARKAGADVEEPPPDLEGLPF